MEVTDFYGLNSSSSFCRGVVLCMSRFTESEDSMDPGPPSSIRPLSVLTLGVHTSSRLGTNVSDLDPCVIILYSTFSE